MVKSGFFAKKLCFLKRPENTLIYLFIFNNFAPMTPANDA